MCHHWLAGGFLRSWPNWSCVVFCLSFSMLFFSMDTSLVYYTNQIMIQCKYTVLNSSFRISPEEQHFLCNNRRLNCNHNQNRNLKTPFLQMMKSGSVHALWITHLCHAWCYVSNFNFLVKMKWFEAKRYRTIVFSRTFYWLFCKVNFKSFKKVFDGGEFDSLRQRCSIIECGNQRDSLVSALSWHVFDDVHSRTFWLLSKAKSDGFDQP